MLQQYNSGCQVMNSLTEGLFWLYLTQRYKLSVFEMKHAGNILGLCVTVVMTYPVPQVAIKLALLSGPHVAGSSKATHRYSYKLHHWFRVCLSVCRFSLWLYSNFISASHHIPQHELWSNGRYDTWGKYFHVMLGLICFLTLFLPFLCSEALDDKHSSIPLEMELFFKGLNPLDCIHSHII